MGHKNDNFSFSIYFHHYHYYEILAHQINCNLYPSTSIGDTSKTLETRIKAHVKMKLIEVSKHFKRIQNIRSDIIDINRKVYIIST